MTNFLLIDLKLAFVLLCLKLQAKNPRSLQGAGISLIN